MNLERLKGFVVSAAVSAAVSFGVVHFAPVAPAAHASAGDAISAAASGTSPIARVSSAAAQGDSGVREECLDACYWDEIKGGRATQ